MVSRGTVAATRRAAGALQIVSRVEHRCDGSFGIAAATTVQASAVDDSAESVTRPTLTGRHRIDVRDEREVRSRCVASNLDENSMGIAPRLQPQIARVLP
jgi:hypothetical protein